MKVLFIGGSGIISSACSQSAIDCGIELYLLNRGHSTRPVPVEAQVLRGDIREPGSAKTAIGNREFDAVVNWVAFTPDHILNRLYDRIIAAQEKT